MQFCTFSKLTGNQNVGITEQSVHINVEKIVMVSRLPKGGSTIHFASDWRMNVKEDSEAIVKMIEDNSDIKVTKKTK